MCATIVCTTLRARTANNVSPPSSETPFDPFMIPMYAVPALVTKEALFTMVFAKEKRTQNAIWLLASVTASQMLTAQSKAFPYPISPLKGSFVVVIGARMGIGICRSRIQMDARSALVTYSAQLTTRAATNMMANVLVSV